MECDPQTTFLKSNNDLAGLKTELTDDIKDKVKNHRNTFHDLFYSRYLEMLPSLIEYQFSEQHKEKIMIDFTLLELMLRHGYNVVVGETVHNTLAILGYTNKGVELSTPLFNYHNYQIKSDKDIVFTIPQEDRLKFYKSISYNNATETGNCVILRNKTVNAVNDFKILDFYTEELAEIVASRFSISIQAKNLTFLIGNIQNETLNQIASAMYNGEPYVKVSELFDAEDHIITVKNAELANNLVELKREYQNKISELNNMLGINSLAVDKSSGVSDVEANSNRAFTTSSANIYLSARNYGLNLLNLKYHLDLESHYNDEVASEFSKIAYSGQGEVQ